jgi:hypothetical protein
VAEWLTQPIQGRPTKVSRVRIPSGSTQIPLFFCFLSQRSMQTAARCSSLGVYPFLLLSCTDSTLVSCIHSHSLACSLLFTYIHQRLDTHCHCSAAGTAYMLKYRTTSECFMTRTSSACVQTRLVKDECACASESSDISFQQGDSLDGLAQVDGVEWMILLSFADGPTPGRADQNVSDLATGEGGIPCMCD